MTDLEILKAVHQLHLMLFAAIKKELLSRRGQVAELQDCQFLSYGPDDMCVETTVTAVYIKEDTVWANFEDAYTGEHSEPIAACFTVDELLSIFDAM